MTAPSLTVIAHDLNIQHPYERQLTLSAFVLAYAFGPFLAAPLSEMYGRRWVLQVFTLVHLASNTGCGFAKTASQLVVCRFFAGFGGR
jgi:MFS family permease